MSEHDLSHSIAQEHRHVLVATLGGQPQIVTFTLDLLLQAGFSISDVIVLHPRASQPRLQHSLNCLSKEFPGDYYTVAGRTIHLHSHVLELDGKPIDDIVSDAHADGTLNTIHQLISTLKRQGNHIHLSVSGGRRLMSLLAISVASINFDRNDHIWHLYTPDAIRKQVGEGQVMHLPPDVEARLIKGQFLSLGPYIYNASLSFRTAQEERRQQMEAHEHALCSQVMAHASPAQLRVLQAFAKGLRPQQVARELYLAPVTVNTHKTALLGLCHNAWNIPNDERLDYHFLRAKFAAYYDGDE